MLASRRPYREILKLLINAEVFIETKFDGERIQVHFQSDGNINFFTRNANDHAYLYGKRFRDLLLEHISGVEACILDGEMIVWDGTADCAVA
jgi:ATP-dependent DNA ligase